MQLLVIPFDSQVRPNSWDYEQPPIGTHLDL